MITRTCKHCGKTYETFPAIRLQFCCAACANAHKDRKVTIVCTVCGKEKRLSPSQADQKYCSRSCAMTARNLTDANPSYTRDVSGEKNPMYGKGFCGEANAMYGKRGAECPNWKGGRKTRKDGYILVAAPDDHPHPSDVSKGRKYILEHRLVMEQHIGRYLEPAEVVHHIDNNPRNNDISNLRLFANQAEHMTLGHTGDLKRRRRRT